jgi:hypothetical protein
MKKFTIVAEVTAFVYGDVEAESKEAAYAKFSEAFKGVWDDRFEIGNGLEMEAVTFPKGDIVAVA